MQKPPRSGEAIGWSGVLFALCATIIWSGNFIVARGLNELIQPATLAFMRWTAACLALLPFAGYSVWQQRTIIREHLGYLVLTAFLGVTMFNTLVYLSAHTTTALNLSLISTSIPIFIIVFSRIFLGEAITIDRAFGLLLTVTGVLLLITKAELSLLLSLNFAVGDLWMLLAATCFGGYSMLIRKKPLELSKGLFLMSTFLLGLLMLLPWVGLELLQTGLPKLRQEILGSVVYLGVGASLCAFFLWTKAIETVGPFAAGLVYYTLPLFSGLGAFLILGEPVSWMHAASGILIFTGILTATRN